MSRSAVLAIALVLVPACGDKAPSSTGASSAAPPASADEGPPPYAAKLEAAPKYERDKPGVVTVVVDAKEGWHINPDYPFKFTIKGDVPGVDFPAMIVTEVKRTESRATLAIPFVPKDAGSKKIEGVCSLSVCKAERCALEKVPLETTVTVE
jgi:hypothetical protein